jgi:hypothetical protein
MPRGRAAQTIELERSCVDILAQAQPASVRAGSPLSTRFCKAGPASDEHSETSPKIQDPLSAPTRRRSRQGMEAWPP